MKDDRLESDAQRQAAEWVSGLPKEEEPNLLWRASLNEGVRLEAERRARKRRRWVLVRPGLGLAAAAALAALVIMPHSTAKVAPAGSRLEAGLIALHQDSEQTADIVGSGLRPSEAPTSSAFDADPFADLDAGAL